MAVLELSTVGLTKLLREETGDPISRATVQRWLSAEDVMSARPIPGWVAAILRHRAGKKAASIPKPVPPV